MTENFRALSAFEQVKIQRELAACKRDLHEHQLKVGT